MLRNVGEIHWSTNFIGHLLTYRLQEEKDSLGSQFIFLAPRRLDDLGIYVNEFALMSKIDVVEWLKQCLIHVTRRSRIRALARSFSTGSCFLKQGVYSKDSAKVELAISMYEQQ